MASGCTSSNSSVPGNFGQKVLDTNVKYTGPAIPSLGICTNDLLSEVETIILNQIVNFSQGIGIMIPDIDLTACSLFTTYITCCNGSNTVPKELDDLMKIIFDALCKLDTRLTVVENEISDLFAGPYNVSCITGLVGISNPTFKQIIQQLLIDYCALKTQVAGIQTQLTTLSNNLSGTIGNFLLTHINSCQSGSLVKTGTGATANLQFSGFVPVGSIVPYHGPMTAFDSSGLGYTVGPACGWALCNGNNGTVDMKGNVPVGTTTMGGLSLTSITTGATYNLDDVGGEIKHKLLVGEIPATPITGTINDPGHDHALFAGTDGAASGNTTQKFNYLPTAGGLGNTAAHNPATPARSSTGGTPPMGYIDIRKTGITPDGLITGGGGGVHENRMPYIALNYIQRIE